MCAYVHTQRRAYTHARAYPCAAMRLRQLSIGFVGEKEYKPRWSMKNTIHHLCPPGSMPAYGGSAWNLACRRVQSPVRGVYSDCIRSAYLFIHLFVSLFPNRMSVPRRQDILCLFHGCISRTRHAAGCSRNNRRMNGLKCSRARSGHCLLLFQGNTNKAVTKL